VIFGVVGLDLAAFVEGEVQKIFVRVKKLRYLELQENCGFRLEQQLQGPTLRFSAHWLKQV
jgi:hypothetical protein